MEFNLHDIDNNTSHYDVVKAIEKVLHDPDLYNPTNRSNRRCPPNFHVYLPPGTHDDDGNLGPGTLVVTSWIGTRLLRWLNEGHKIRILDKDIATQRSSRIVPLRTAQILERTPYVDPERERMRKEILQKLDHRLQLHQVQFGVWHAHTPRSSPLPLRAFSVEYGLDFAKKGAGHLKLEYDNKLIRIEYGGNQTQPYNIVIRFSNVRKLETVVDTGKGYIFVDMLVPPALEFRDGAVQGGQRRPYKDRDRIPALNIVHARVAPYAYQLRICLHDIEDLPRFRQLCRDAKGPRPEPVPRIFVFWRDFFSGGQLSKIDNWVRSMEWKNAFQIEALLRHGLLNPRELLYELRDPIDRVCQQYGKGASEILRRLTVSLRRIRSAKLTEIFERVCAEYEDAKPLTSPPGAFLCHHVTITPTRLILEGPYITQSNRVIRHYQDHDPDLVENFIRVDFREEDRTSYRWAGNVDGTWFLKERVGGTLKGGFELAGRTFQYLAHSNSSLRDHAAWFMSPFMDPEEGVVAAGKIRQRLGDFTSILNQPSKYAARMAQAFTSTDSSVKIRRDQWEEMPDLGPEKYLHTDGVGTISRELNDMIWDTLRKNKRDNGINCVKPSAYQIRFLGYKGVVVIDERLTGVKMRLRPSMKKFLVHEDDEADIEIARAFDHPNASYLNRPVIMVLEDRGVHKNTFMDLQEKSKASIYMAMDSLDNFCTLLTDHGLGSSFSLSFIFEQLSKLKLDTKPGKQNILTTTPFLGRLGVYSMYHVLRDIKYRARIRVPNGYLLVGVADEGNSYINEGVDPDEVFTLKEGQIFACVQESAQHEPRWLKGYCVISRSPVVHPGDVKRVWAVGKPPEDKLCFFRNLKNVVVFPTSGNRSLASCLGGGDLDGDLFDVYAQNPKLLPTLECEPAEYDPGEIRKVEWDSTVEDICDFFVEYINSDVLGLLSDRHLTIADQSGNGTFDPHCMRLAGLCSQAVDYAKNGMPVDLKNNRLPRMLIPFKPDWKQKGSGSRSADFYESDRALGHLFRSVDLPDPNASLRIVAVPMNMGSPLSDPVSLGLIPLVRRTLGDRYTHSSGKSATAATLFAQYSRELQYIRVTHTLSENPDIELTEEEIVVGTIIANCTDMRWHRERKFRMRQHVDMLVAETRQRLMPAASNPDATEDEDQSRLKTSLQDAWEAWAWSLRHANQEGSSSFGLIALGVIFDALKRLGALSG